MRITLLLPAVLMMAALSGCVTQRPVDPRLVQSDTIDRAPKDLLQHVRRIITSPPLSLPVRDEQQGTIVTGWQQPFQGEMHVVRYWHERTRYHITVIPDWNDPAHRSRIQIVDETEQRPDDSGPNQEAKIWSAAPNIHRPERAQAVLHQIEIRLLETR